MTMVVCVPYTGYVPGQIIPLTIELDNNSSVEIEDVKIKLERVIFKTECYLNVMVYKYRWFYLGTVIQSKKP